MALIPITFKADIPDNKKGNIRAEDFSALLSFGLSKDAGILNITGQDCSAFGNINVVGSTAQVTFHKGYVVIFGRAIYVEEGTQVAFNLPSSGTVNGVLGIKVNLAESGANEVSWFQKTTTPQIDDLLNKNAGGVYEFVIYNYTATPNSFTLSEENKTTQIIKNIKDADFITRNNDNKSKNIATTEFVHNLLSSFVVNSNAVAVNNQKGYIDIPVYNAGGFKGIRFVWFKTKTSAHQQNFSSFAIPTFSEVLTAWGVLNVASVYEKSLNITNLNNNGLTVRFGNSSNYEDCTVFVIGKY